MRQQQSEAAKPGSEHWKQHSSIADSRTGGTGAIGERYVADTREETEAVAEQARICSS